MNSFNISSFFVKIVYCIDNIILEVYLLLFTVAHEIVQTLMETFYECIMYYTFCNFCNFFSDLFYKSEKIYI